VTRRCETIVDGLHAGRDAGIVVEPQAVLDVCVVLYQPDLHDDEPERGERPGDAAFEPAEAKQDHRGVRAQARRIADVSEICPAGPEFEHTCACCGVVHRSLPPQQR
jgi:hypothetical protein